MHLHEIQIIRKIRILQAQSGIASGEPVAIPVGILKPEDADRYGCVTARFQAVLAPRAAQSRLNDLLTTAVLGWAGCITWERSVITDQRTEHAQQAKPAEPEGTLRAELQDQLGTASDALTVQLAELRSLAPDSASASAIAGCAAQLASLNALQRSVSVATGGNLAALRMDISAAVAASSAVQQQARAAVEAGTAAASPLAVTSAATRHEVTSLADDLFNHRIFDRYLTFSSPEEEAAYREREAERQRYIAQQLAKGTPEGELNAAGATAGQMLDANAHGAGESPEFLPRWNRLADTIHKHRDAMQQAGQSTAEYDREIAASTRRFLKSKGLTDSEVEARLSGSADPLEAVKPFLKTEQDARALDRNLTHPALEKPDATMNVVAASPAESTMTQPAAVPGLDDVMAKLRASGVAAAVHQPEEQVDHGLAGQEHPATIKPGPARG